MAISCGNPQDLDGDGVFAPSDCNDLDDQIAPGRPERCNQIDDDCDGDVDEGVLLTLFADRDLDGFGDPAVQEEACELRPGLSDLGIDCDDTDSTIHPEGNELCNERDDDCDGLVDEDLFLSTLYADADGDGFGDPDVAVSSCAPPAGWVYDNTDCNDTDASAWPGAEEICDGADDDCDGIADEGFLVSRYVDADHDGYGNPNAVIETCPDAPGTSLLAGDCDDANDAIHPEGSELCNERDDDCDGLVDEGVSTPYYLDADGDGFGSGSPVPGCAPPVGYVEDNTDCNDAEPLALPGGIESCDLVDNDCDGQIDEGMPTSWWLDADGDGLGDPLVRINGCAPPAADFVDNNGDCNDRDAAIPPSCTASLWGDWPTAGRNPTRDAAVPGFVGESPPSLLWSVDLDSERIEPIAIADGVLFVTLGYYFDPVMAIVALDLATGTELWRYDAGSSVSSLSGPTVAAGMVCLTQCYGDRGDLVMCLDATTGQERWASDILMQFETYMPSLEMDGVLYSGGGQFGGLYGHDLATGAELFFAYLPQSDDWGPAGFDGLVYTWVDEALIAHDPLDGMPLWERSYGGWWQSDSMPAISEEGVAHVIGNTTLRAIDLRTGALRWSRSVDLVATPAVGDGWVYATRWTGSVQQYSAIDGTPGLSFSGDGSLTGQPILALDALIAASPDNTYVFDLATGSQRFQIPFGGAIAVADNHLVIVDRGGHVRTLGW